MEDHLLSIEVGAAGSVYLRVDEVLTVWRDDERPDRASTPGDPENRRTIFTLLKQTASPVVPPHVLVAAEARYFSGRMWSASPAESIRLLIRAWLAGALSASQVTKLSHCRESSRNVDPTRVSLTRLYRLSIR